MSAKGRIIPVFVPHLGCPNDCVFCNQRRISGAKSPADGNTVRSAIEKAISMHITDELCQLAFYGGSFTAIPIEQQNELLGTAKEYIDRAVIHSIRLSTRPDAIDGEALARLKKYTVETIELGAQSLNDEVLLLSGRGHTAEDVEIASKMVKASGYKLVLQMMTGLPGDTLDRSVDTARKIIALKPDGVRVYPTVIVKDTALFDLWKAGLYNAHTVEEAVSWGAVILPMFEKAGIPVIRYGLNPTDDLSAGTAVGGAYHPALGEMVKSRIMRNNAEALLQNSIKSIDDRGQRISLGVNKSQISQMIGQHRCNMEYLNNRFKLSGITVKAANVKMNEIVMMNVEK